MSDHSWDGLNSVPTFEVSQAFISSEKMNLKQSDDTEAALGKMFGPAIEPKFWFFPQDMPGENVLWPLRVSSITWVRNIGLNICFIKDYDDNSIWRVQLSSLQAGQVKSR